MVELQDVSKTYQNGSGEPLKALSHVSLSFPDKGFFAILGPSGCGKTTLLNLISLLDKPSEGHLYFSGKDLNRLNEKEANAYRAKEIGFVFQECPLVPHLSLLDNVLLPSLFLTEGRNEETKKKALDLLNQLGLGGRLKDAPSNLSGGEKQRVAIARALLNGPAVILADEPTGSLDKASAREVMGLLKTLSRDRLVILVSHNETLVEEYVDGMIHLDGGVVVSQTLPAPSAAENKVAPAYHSRTKATALFRLAFLHVKNRPLKSLLLVLAGSVGLIGAGLVYGIGSGLGHTTGEMESELLSDFPVTIVPYYYGAQSTLFSSTEGFFPDDDVVVPRDEDQIPHVNSFTSEYLNFLHSAVKDEQLTVNYATLASVLYQNSEGSISLSSAKSSSSLDSFKESFLGQGAAYHPLGASEDFILSKYDVISGHYPQNDNEAFLMVGKSNELPSKTIADLGLSLVNKKIASSTILGRHYKMVSNQESYVSNSTSASVSGYFLKSRTQLAKEGKSLGELCDDLVKAAFYYSRGETGDSLIGQRYLGYASDFFLNVQSTRTLQGYQLNPSLKEASFFADESKGKAVEIVGILRPKRKTFIDTLGGGLYYSKNLNAALMDENSASPIAEEIFSHLVLPEAPSSSSPSYPSFYLDLEKLTEEKTSTLQTAGEKMLSFIETAQSYGSEKTISSIEIFPQSFADKDAILASLDDYNARHLSAADKVVYTDFGGAFKGTVDSYLSLIYLVLWIFGGVSLIVTIVLVGLLSHNAVISRKKEIGLLRSLGASRGAVIMLFLSEAFFLSLLAGVLALGVTYLGYFLVNLKVASLGFSLYFQAAMPVYGAFLLLLLSLAIFMLGSLFPAYHSSQEKPQLALRSD